MKIEDTTVSRKHLKLVVRKDGSISFENLSPNGTYVNGTRVDKGVVSETDVIGLGPYFKAKLADLIVVATHDQASLGSIDRIPQKDIVSIDVTVAKSYYDYKTILKKFRKISELKDLLSSAESLHNSLPLYVIPMIQTALASRLMKSGEVGAAQDYLYKAGDFLYERQDGSPLFESCYASVMTLLSELYYGQFKYTEAEIAGRYAIGIYSRWRAGEMYVPEANVGNAYAVYGDALKRTGKIDASTKAYNKAIDIYRKAGEANPTYFSSKILEIEQRRVK